MKIWKDKRFGNWVALKTAILAESSKQIEKWGVQERTPFEWLTYTTEELGELAQAIGDWFYRGGDKERIYKEAIQVATLSLKIAEMAEFGDEK